MESELGKFIREKRTKLGLTQSDIATHCACSIVYISDIERGRRPATDRMIVAFSEKLNVPLVFLQEKLWTDRRRVEITEDLNPKAFGLAVLLRHSWEKLTSKQINAIAGVIE